MKQPPSSIPGFRHRPSTLALRFLGLLFPCSLIGGADAATTIYTDRAAFLAALSASHEDDFEDLSSGVHSAPMNRGTGDYLYSIHVYNELWTETGSLITKSASGSIGLGTLSSYNTVEFVFSNSLVNAFGGYFWGSDYDGTIWSGGAEVHFTLSDGTSFTLSNITDTSGFVGFITDGETWDWIDIESFPDRPSFDNLIIGTTAPEPSSLLLSSLALLGLIRRRR